MTQTNPKKPVTEKQILNYVATFGATPADKAAEFFNWFAQVCPGRCLEDLSIATKVAYSLSAKPRTESEQVLLFKRSKVESMKQTLHNRYRRAWQYFAASGYRCSIDDTDIMLNFVKPRRIGSAVSKVDWQLELVNRAKLPPDLQERYDKLAKELKVMHIAASRLLPKDATPPAKDDDKTKK